MKLNELLAGHDHRILQGDPHTSITAGTCIDADRAAPGSLYIAVPGHHEGGPALITQALARGAAAVLIDTAQSTEPGRRLPSPAWAGKDVCVIAVPDTRSAAALTAARYYREPGRHMDMIAVTGTNGKTSVAHMVESVLRIAENAKVGVIGTGGSRIGEDSIPMPMSVLTTPESPDFQYLLGHMRDQETGTVVLEATSMGLLNHRIDHAHIDIGIFTNLTQDHLDDHGTMDNYRDAKMRLFQGQCRHAIVNADDPVSTLIHTAMPGAVTTYALDTEADYRATDLITDIRGTRFTLHHHGHKYPAAVPTPGRYSVANALATLAACHTLGHDLNSLITALERTPGAPGRFQRYETPTGTTVIIDFAHSPDSLEKVLTTIKTLTTGRVITVFGCGGDRDTTKRATMGHIAGAHSDLCILTSDNPRTEDPETILDHIAQGLARTETPHTRRTNRRDAIATALTHAQPGDTILIAGKGSEPHQIIGTTHHPYSDHTALHQLTRLHTPPAPTRAPRVRSSGQTASP